MLEFIDTEFYEDGRTIDLISIGVAAEDGREFYACSTEAKLHLVSDWVKEHVVSQLPPAGDPAWMSRADLLHEDSWSLFIAGPRVDSWGFWDIVKQTHIPWRAFIARKRGIDESKLRPS